MKIMKKLFTLLTLTLFLVLAAVPVMALAEGETAAATPTEPLTWAYLATIGRRGYLHAACRAAFQGSAGQGVEDSYQSICVYRLPRYHAACDRLYHRSDRRKCRAGSPERCPCHLYCHGRI